MNSATAKIVAAVGAGLLIGGSKTGRELATEVAGKGWGFTKNVYGDWREMVGSAVSSFTGLFKSSKKKTAKKTSKK